VACRRNHQDLILPGECSDLTGHSPQLDIDLTAKLNRDLAELPLSHAAITLTSSSSDPGVGQKQVERVLREARELVLAEVLPPAVRPQLHGGPNTAQAHGGDEHPAMAQSKLPRSSSADPAGGSGAHAR
jgi:hypothetical protein